MASSSSKGASRVFTQTATSDDLDRWVQVGEEEARMAYEMTLRNELSGGTQVVRDFEAMWREMTGLDFAVATNNGTSALFSAMFGLGVGPGDEVICPTFNWIGAIASAPFLGARPVFCESDPRTLLADPEDIRRRITPRTRAILVVHLWGYVCDMDAVMALSRETGIPVIEDCSHAHGALYRGRPVGSNGDVAAWSLQGSKPVSAGEAGMVATSDPEIFDRICMVGQVNRIAGMDLTTHRYERYQPLGSGMKFRAHPVGLGIATVQLRKLPKLNQGRAGWVRAIEEGVAGIDCLEPVSAYEGTTRGGFYGFPIHYVPEKSRATVKDFVGALRDEGIKAATNYYPLLHTLPFFAEGFDLYTRDRGPLCGDYPGYKLGDLPVTEKACHDIIMLPMLTDPAEGAVEWFLERMHRVAERYAV